MPMRHKPLQKEELMGSLEIIFKNRQEFNYPQLMRLSLDFEVCILQLQHQVFSHITKRFLPTEPLFILTDRNYLSSCATYSPRCNSLSELEAYASVHHVDILHEHLFGSIAAENSD
jgi:N-formylglutamate amidohydrolase